jgi:hypothetical protein
MVSSVSLIRTSEFAIRRELASQRSLLVYSSYTQTGKHTWEASGYNSKCVALYESVSSGQGIPKGPDMSQSS